MFASQSSASDITKMTEISLLRILIATDCHLGFEETDRVIGEDSFVTFEEVLIKAVDEEADLILLGGDLFHHNNPSQKTMNRCIELLRQYTLGDGSVKFELLSRASDVFSHCISQTANFLDENINVSIPVFSIHGNHDDPSGLGQYSSLDTLSSAGLVNYFGKWTDLNEIKIKPILIKKGTTYFALYGLSYIKDDRLCRLFMEKQVTFLEPETDPEKYFKLLVLHQNRADRGPKRFISESLLPSFFDLVIWGHEHDCEIQPLWNLEKEFYVVQPGSTVATSLSEGESKPKHIGLLKLWQNYSKFEPIKLNTVRPFIWDSVRFMDLTSIDNENPEEIREYCVDKVEQMIKEAKDLLTGHPKQPKLPLIRLRCEYNEQSQLFNVVKFGQQFLNRVATPNLEIIKLKRVVEVHKKGEALHRTEEINRLKSLYEAEVEENQSFIDCVNSIVNDYFTEHPESKMTVLSASEMGLAVEKFIDKEETDIVERVVDRKLKKVMGELMVHSFENEDDIMSELERWRDRQLEKSDVEKD